MTKVTALGQFIIEKQAGFPYAKGELSKPLAESLLLTANALIPA